MAVAILAACLAACTPTKPPVDALGVATRNLEAAHNAGADAYAPIEVKSASDHLEAAHSAMAREDYDAAARLAAESAVDSELAAAKARLGKARESVENLKQKNAELSNSLPKAGQGAGFQ